ncbi:prepilin-type N-terminal cleavage/methylation domain-containing protein [Idiomarina seosinensis]|uniref:prepilin-type N-terminal cleavage/methylation domain-containing protein n=1 Tax=Idiomarina seosinensis TaxID=281739 RepID=UPI00384E7C38
MENRTRGTRGFTLIELLISMVIMIMIMVLGTTSYLLYANTWKRNSDQFDRTTEDYRRIELVTQALERTVPYYVTEQENPAFYFLGRREGLTGITASSVTRPDQMAIYRLFREPSEAGGLQLVYEEAAINEPLRQLDQELPFNYRAVLFTAIDRLEFDYYGWPNRRVQLNQFEDNDARQEWFEAYDGAERLSHPTELRVTLNDYEWLIQVPDITTQLLSQQEQDE